MSTKKLQVFGLKGPKGDPGDPGKNAYEYAKDGGYTGTEEDFKKNLAFEILNANPDQIVIVKSVDNNGRPTEWKTMDKDHTHSYNDLTDKPFGEEETSIVIEGLEDISNTYVTGETSWHGPYYKVSDTPLTKEEMSQISVNYLLNSTLNTKGSDSWWLINDEDCGKAYWANIHNDHTLEANIISVIEPCKVSYTGVEFAEAGVYFSTDRHSEYTIVKLETSRIETKLIDENYIPESISRTNHTHDGSYAAVDHTHSYNDLTDRTHYTYVGEGVVFEYSKETTTSSYNEDSNIKNTYVLEEGKTYKVAVNDTESEWVAAFNDENENVIYIGSSTFSGADGEFYFTYNLTTGENYIFFYTKSGTFSFAIYGETVLYQPLDENYIPETIARKDDIPDSVGVKLPTDSSTGDVLYGTEGQFAISDGQGGITWITITDGNEVAY